MTVFISLLNDNDIITRNTIEELVSIPHLEIYFKKELYRERKNTFGNTDFFYKYTIVDEKGNKKILNIGQFEITEISPETTKRVKVAGIMTNRTGRDIIVFDKSKSRNNIYRSNIEGDKFLINEFLLLVNTLRKIPDWDIFIALSNIPILEKEITALKREIQVQKDKINKLKQAK